MDQGTFLDAVRDRADLGEAEAERAVEATLATLAERLSDGEASDVAAQLPAALRRLMPAGGGEGFDLDEMHRRVAERGGLPPSRAGAVVDVVLGVLYEALDPGEVRDLLAQLPSSFPPHDRVGETVDRGVRQGALHDGERELRGALEGRSHAGSWHAADVPGAWRAASADGTEEALIQSVAGEFEARVYRHPTGPTGPDPKLAHGPVVFGSAAEALDYVEERMSWSRTT